MYLSCTELPGERRLPRIASTIAIQSVKNVKSVHCTNRLKNFLMTLIMGLNSFMELDHLLDSAGVNFQLMKLRRTRLDPRIMVITAAQDATDASVCTSIGREGLKRYLLLALETLEQISSKQPFSTRERLKCLVFGWVARWYSNEALDANESIHGETKAAVPSTVASCA